MVGGRKEGRARLYEIRVVSICRSFQRALPPEPKPPAKDGLAAAHHSTAAGGKPMSSRGPLVLTA